MHHLVDEKRWDEFALKTAKIIPNRFKGLDPEAQKTVHAFRIGYTVISLQLLPVRHFVSFHLFYGPRESFFPRHCFLFGLKDEPFTHVVVTIHAQTNHLTSMQNRGHIVDINWVVPHPQVLTRICEC